MPSNLNAPSLRAVILAALLLCAHGAPPGNAPTDNPADDSSGEEAETAAAVVVEVKSTTLQDNIKNLLDKTVIYNQDFVAEFQNAVSSRHLEEHKPSSLPAKCPLSNSSKEASLQRLAEGLQTYTVLLKYVESVYPNNMMVSNIKYEVGQVIKSIKDEMKNSKRVTPLTSSQEKQLLDNLNNRTDTFQRKMTVHSIMKELHIFILDCKRAINRRQMPRRRVAKRNISSVNLHYQILER